MIGAMTELTGTAELTRFIVRRDRIRILVWVFAVAGLVALTVVGIKGLYPTQADLDQAAAASQGNAAAIVFNGPAQSLNTVGGEVAFQAGAMGMVVVALMSLLMIGRLTRGEEEAGRLELLRSLPVGSCAPIASASFTVAAMNVAVGVATTLAMLAQHLPAAGSLTLGTSFMLLGLVFGGVALLAAQITENVRVVYGVAGVVLGAAFVVRAVGDIGDGTVSWFSPIGWAQKARPFAGQRWWPFLLLVVATTVLVATASVLAGRRDLGEGLMAPRPGRSCAAPSLGRPIGLAVRLQRGSLTGWSVGVLVAGVGYGSIAPSIDTFVGRNKALADMLARAGGASLTDSYLATSFRTLALIGTGFAIQSALRLRSEETSMRAEAVLATPVSRWRWAASHLTVAFAGSVVLLALAGLAVGLSYGVVGGDLSVVPHLVGDALVYAPAMWLLVGFTVALVGLAPRGAVASWAILTVCLVVGLLGPALGVPRWLQRLSPFERTAQLPAAHLTYMPFMVLIAVAAALTLAGLTGLRRRDIG